MTEATSDKLEVLTVAETAATLKVHPRTVSRLVRAGLLHGSRIGSVWRFERREIEAYLERVSTKNSGLDNGTRSQQGG